MPLDGTVIANIKHELSQASLNGRIDKIYQTENDEIILSIRGFGKNFKLLITASSSHPRVHYTSLAKENPSTPPMFCMVLRKHLNNGRIISIEQPGFERILEFHIEAMNEMGDLAIKRLIVEIMGKHSNVILVDAQGNIIDSIKHVSYDKSSVRQVLPGKLYEAPPSQNKMNPLEYNRAAFIGLSENKLKKKFQEVLYQSYTGISPVLASEICARAGLDPSDVLENNVNAMNVLADKFEELISQIKNNQFAPSIYYGTAKKSEEFASFELSMFSGKETKQFKSISALLETFYGEKDALYRTAQKTHDLRKLVQNHIERLSRKQEMQHKTLSEIADRDALKVYGELLTANIYALEKGMTSYTAVNYYDPDNSLLDIPLDPDLTPVENAQKYFKKYNKEKRTYAALQEQIKTCQEDLFYLESLMLILSGTLTEIEISEIRQELFEQGFIKKGKKTDGRKKVKSSKPLHYLSSDGFHIYVGRNNKQNDELTLQFAAANDLWLHTKNIPGSHVIVKIDQKQISDQTIEEAAHLAVYFSKARESSMVPVDYTLKKFVKKPNGAKPGMVIYETYQTAFITQDSKLIGRMEMIND